MGREVHGRVHAVCWRIRRGTILRRRRRRDRRVQPRALRGQMPRRVRAPLGEVEPRRQRLRVRSARRRARRARARREEGGLAEAALSCETQGQRFLPAPEGSVRHGDRLLRLGAARTREHRLLPSGGLHERDHPQRGARLPRPAVHAGADRVGGQGRHADAGDHRWLSAPFGGRRRGMAVPGLPQGHAGAEEPHAHGPGLQA